MPIPSICKGCLNLHGVTYHDENYQELPTLVCGFHPYGADDDTCSDLEKFDYALMPNEYLVRHLAKIKTIIQSKNPEMPAWVLELTAIAQARDTHLMAVELAIRGYIRVSREVRHHFATHSDLVWNDLLDDYRFEIMMNEVLS